MEKITREQFLDRLQNSWLPFPGRFYTLSALDQAAFLKKQGYARLGDLLGHIIAWWQDGVSFIEAARGDPSLPLPEIEVNAFNAAAVARFTHLSDAELVQVYETQRQVMVSMLNSLTAAELERDNINTRLYYEIISHWAEHELNAPKE